MMRPTPRQSQGEWRSTPALVATLALAFLMPVAAPAQQPCNPVIDGTFCAEQMPRGGRTSRPPDPMIRPIGSIGSSISTSSGPAGTLGGISIRRDGTSCVGLLRRGACS